MKFASGNGFSLLEALIVLALLGVLLLAAAPAWERHWLRAGRFEAQQELMETAADQERYRARNGVFVADAWPLWTPVTEGRRRLTRTGRYQIEVRACPNRSLALCFIATARAQGRQGRDECDVLTLTSDGVRGAGAASVEACWQ